MDLQTAFITNKGSVRTMFDNDGNLLPEASIIKSTDKIQFILNNISDDDLLFLLYNSPEFVKNVMNSNWLTINDMVRLMKVLFEFPINEELWNVLNHKNISHEIDYRELLIRKIVISLTFDGLYNKVPEAMAFEKRAPTSSCCRVRCDQRPTLFGFPLGKKKLALSQKLISFYYYLSQEQ